MKVKYFEEFKNIVQEIGLNNIYSMSQYFQIASNTSKNLLGLRYSQGIILNVIDIDYKSGELIESFWVNQNKKIKNNLTISEVENIIVLFITLYNDGELSTVLINEEYFENRDNIMKIAICLDEAIMTAIHTKETEIKKLNEYLISIIKKSNLFNIYNKILDGNYPKLGFTKSLDYLTIIEKQIADAMVATIVEYSKNQEDIFNSGNELDFIDEVLKIVYILLKLVH